MPNPAKSKQKKRLHTFAMVNAVIWAFSLIALARVLEKGSNPNGMFVMFAGETTADALSRRA